MKRKILIVEDNVGLSQMQKDWLLQAGYEVTTAIDEPAARRLLRRTAFDLILSDVRLPEGDGISLLEWTRGERMTTPYIVMTEYATVSDAVRAIRSGAKDYLPKPVHKERLLEMADEILRPLSTVQREEKVLFRRRSAQARHVERLAALVAPSDMSVLILGANGTGKESVARNIHRSSERRNMPFVAVNCGVLPKELAASLFFGHVKGAFTGADANREGYFSMAEGGTLFLDEIGDMPAELQTRLLRVLSDGYYYRVGGHQSLKANVRIIAATHQNLEAMVRENRFREDLYHRLNVIRLRLPPLRERPEDIPLLVNHFLQKSAENLGVEPKLMSEEAMEFLKRFPFPGNVRQLENLCNWLVVMAPSQHIRVTDLPEEVRNGEAEKVHKNGEVSGSTPAGGSWEELLKGEVKEMLKNQSPDLMKQLADTFESIVIGTALEYTHGRRVDAATRLGIGRNTITRKIAELKLESED